MFQDLIHIQHLLTTKNAIRKKKKKNKQKNKKQNKKYQTKKKKKERKKNLDLLVKKIIWILRQFLWPPKTRLLVLVDSNLHLRHIQTR